MELETFERLLAPIGQGLLADVAASAGNESDLALGTRLRRTHDPALVAAAVTQVHLRGKARTKLGAAAALMYFTHDALEQATRASVSDHRAHQLLARGGAAVTDLGCGIGGDLISFSRAGMETYGVELDPLRAAMAAANLRALGLAGSVEVGRAEDTAPVPGRTTFVDPARRDGRGRVFQVGGWRPDWGMVTALLDGDAVAKTMPGIAHALVPPGVEAEWVSDGGDLVEACLWGRLLASAQRRATVLPAAATLTEADDPGDAAVGSAGAYLYEPDDAVIRAGLVTAVCALTDGRLLDRHIAYVSADVLVRTPFARAFAVVDEVPYREKALRGALRARDVGTLTIKKRGIQVSPEQLRGRLALRGSRPATLVLTRVDGAGRAFLVEPVPRR